MRLIQVIASLASSTGGPAIAARELNAALRSRGVDATLLTTDNYGLHNVGDASSAADLRVYPKSPPSVMENSFALARAVWKEARHADVVELHGLYRLPCVYGYLAARRWGKPYGIQPHGTLEPYIRAQSARQKAIFDALIGSRILRGASYVIFTAESEASRAADVVEPAQALVATLGAALAPPVADPEIETALAGFDRADCVLFLGRLARKKRPDLLIEAWAQVPVAARKRLVIAGPDDHFTARELGDIARRLGVAESVVLVGEVSGPQKSWLYQRCGIFVLPSENENFGMTIAEALLSGAYVLTTDQVAAQSHAVSAGAGTVLERPDALSLAAALTRLLEDGAVPDELRERAVRYASEHLSWEPMAEALHTRLTEVLAPRVPASR